MSIRVLLVSVGLLVLAGPALAKPPDLPVEVGGTCLADAQPAPEPERGPATEEPAAEADALCPCLDLFGPCICQLLTSWCQQLTGAASQPAIAIEVGPPTPVAGDQARRLYQRAERYFRQGSTSRALPFYRQVRALAPDSAYGRRALNRLIQIETRSVAEDAGSDEAQEAPPLPRPKKPDALPNMLDNTLLLETFLDEPVIYLDEAPATDGGSSPSGKWDYPPQAGSTPQDRR